MDSSKLKIEAKQLFKEELLPLVKAAEIKEEVAQTPKASFAIKGEAFKPASSKSRRRKPTPG